MFKVFLNIMFKIDFQKYFQKNKKKTTNQNQHPQKPYHHCTIHDCAGMMKAIENRHEIQTRYVARRD